MATNENGVVMTSSPGPTPARRTARCRPAVPLETPAANRVPTQAAKSSSKRRPTGPSESIPERSTSSTSCSSARRRPAAPAGSRGSRAPAPAVARAVVHRPRHRRGPSYRASGLRGHGSGAYSTRTTRRPVSPGVARRASRGGLRDVAVDLDRGQRHPALAVARDVHVGDVNARLAERRADRGRSCPAGRR